MKKKNKYLYILTIIIFCLSFFLDYYNTPKKNEKKAFASDALIVNYLDVGEGDSIFIKLPNNETLLIDAGEKEMSDRVINFINDLGYEKINYIIATHPHTDHIGGLESVINNFAVDKIYMPKVSSNTKTFESLLYTIKEKGLTVTTAKSGVYLLNDETKNLTLQFLAPNSSTYKNLNNYSAVLKLTYQNTHFLFMGDAEVKSEQEITLDPTADVIKVGHHGSDTSSSLSFLKRVNPKYAIIMVGKDNQYHHPYQNIINRYQNLGATIYRTDLSGTIICKSDGVTVNCEGSKKGE